MSEGVVPGAAHCERRPHSPSERDPRRRRADRDSGPGLGTGKNCYLSFISNTPVQSGPGGFSMKYFARSA